MFPLNYISIFLFNFTIELVSATIGGNTIQICNNFGVSMNTILEKIILLQTMEVLIINILPERIRLVFQYRGIAMNPDPNRVLSC